MGQILKINNSYINEIISSTIPVKNLLTEDAIIAGGFPLAVYLKVESTKDDFLPLLIRKINRPSKPYSTHNNELLYTDIDIWVKNNSSNLLLNNLLEFDPISPIKINEISLRLTKKSKWANTFSTTCGQGLSFPNVMQFIKDKYQSPEDLISTFDLNICKVAWCNGDLFVDEEVMNEIRNCEFSFSPNYDFGNENFITKIYRSLRYIKYAKRYNLEPSSNICEYIFKTFLYSSGENLKYGIMSNNINSVITIDNYHKEYNKTYNMYHSLINNITYEWFSNCKNFKKEWSLFLLDHPHITIVQSLIEGKKKNDTIEVLF